MKEQIINEVLNEYNITLLELSKRKRYVKIIKRRKVLAWILFNYTDIKLYEIGKILGNYVMPFDSQTVQNLIDGAEQMINSRDKLSLDTQKEINRICIKLGFGKPIKELEPLGITRAKYAERIERKDKENIYIKAQRLITLNYTRTQLADALNIKRQQLDRVFRLYNTNYSKLRTELYGATKW